MLSAEISTQHADHEGLNSKHIILISFQGQH